MIKIAMHCLEVRCEMAMSTCARARVVHGSCEMEPRKRPTDIVGRQLNSIWQRRSAEQQRRYECLRVAFCTCRARFGSAERWWPATPLVALTEQERRHECFRAVFCSNPTRFVAAERWWAAASCVTLAEHEQQWRGRERVSVF